METDVKSTTETKPEPATEPAAVRALGPLFKITQVFLWDDDSAEVAEGLSASVPLDSVAQEATNLHHSTVSTAISSHIDTATDEIGFTVPFKDMELIQQMNELGLPVSFSTNKEKRNVVTKEKRKPHQKSLSGHKHFQEPLAEASRVSEEENCLQIYRDKTKMCCLTKKGEHDSSCCCFAEDRNKQAFSGDGDPVQATCQLHMTIGQQQNCREITAVKKVHPNYCLHESIVSKENAALTMQLNQLDAENSAQNCFKDCCTEHDHERSCKGLPDIEELEGGHTTYDNRKGIEISDGNEVEQPGALVLAEPYDPTHHSDANLEHEYDRDESGDDLSNWRAVWDDFYQRNYFYNISMQESTWYPPPGMVHLSFSDGAPYFSATLYEESMNNTCLAISSKEIQALDAFSSQEYTNDQQGLQTDHSLCSQSPHTVKSSVDLSPSNCFSLCLPTTCCSGMLLDDREKKINCFENTRSSKEDLHPVDISSYSGTQEPVYSLRNLVNQVGSEEVCEVKLALGNSRTESTDGIVSFGTSDKPEESATLYEDFPFVVSNAKRSVTEVTEVSSEETKGLDIPLTYMDSTVDEIDGRHDFCTSKRKKKLRKRSRRKKLSSDEQEGTLDGLNVSTMKYWWQRYILFSRFDDGIKMDVEGWFSVTPEPIARHQAFRYGRGIVIDCFTGVGGNAIQFAKRCDHVIAIDIDPKKIDYAQHNATIYGVDESIDFISGDFFGLAPKLKGDVVFLSPPWGGPDYAKVETYNISTMLKPHDGYFLFKIASSIASTIIMFLPRNVDINQLAELSLLASPPWSLEVEKNFLNGKLKAVTAYFSSISRQSKSSCL